VLSFLSPFYYNFNENNPSDSCFSDQSSLNIFEPIRLQKVQTSFTLMGEGLTNADATSTARPMSATAIETQVVGVSASHRAAANFSINCYHSWDNFLFRIKYPQ